MLHDPQFEIVVEVHVGILSGRKATGVLRSEEYYKGNKSTAVPLCGLANLNGECRSAGVPSLACLRPS